MRFYKLCVDPNGYDGRVSYRNQFFSDLVTLFDYASQFEDVDHWQLRIFPVDVKVKYPWSKVYDE